MPSGEATIGKKSGFWMLALLIEVPLARMLWVADLRHHIRGDDHATCSDFPILSPFGLAAPSK